jgi:hypothetical protein
MRRIVMDKLMQILINIKICIVEGWNPRSTRHCGHQWPIVPAPGDYDEEEIGGMIGRGNRSTQRKPAPVLFVHHKPHMLPVSEPGPPRWEASV